MGRSDARHGYVIDDLVRLSHAETNSHIVVAIPSEDDPVWKQSSEPVPHLTLLYLDGAAFGPTEFDLVSGYVEHASSCLHPFMLDVKRRGELGDKNADVLFFNQRWTKDIETFRSQLLQNDLVAKSYLSMEQFPEWVPHLTMGYPTSPAKKVPEELSKLWYVNFDRIALWGGDYEGPTFQLEPKDYSMEVAMSQAQRGRAFIMGDGISHYGVKGMHWGVRRGDSSGGGSAPAAKPAPRPRISEDAKNVEKAFGKIDRGGTDTLSNHELQSVVTRLNLEQQYSRLTSSGTAQAHSVERGHQAVKQMLGVGKTINDVHKFMRSPTGKAIVKGVKAVKFGVKVYTNPAGAAVDLIRPKNHFTNTGN